MVFAPETLYSNTIKLTHHRIYFLLFFLFSFFFSPFLGCCLPQSLAKANVDTYRGVQPTRPTQPTTTRSDCSNGRTWVLTQMGRLRVSSFKTHETWPTQNTSISATFQTFRTRSDEISSKSSTDSSRFGKISLLSNEI